MARKPKSEIIEGDWVWVLSKTSIIRYDGNRIDQVTVELPNGHRATMTFDPEKIRRADD